MDRRRSISVIHTDGGPNRKLFSHHNPSLDRWDVILVRDWDEPLDVPPVAAHNEVFAFQEGSCNCVHVLCEGPDLPEVGKETNGYITFGILLNQPVKLLVCWKIGVRKVEFNLREKSPGYHGIQAI